MKKILICILTIIMLISFSSCLTAPFKNKEKATDTKTSTQCSSIIEDVPAGDVQNFGLYSLEEYNAFVSRVTLPDDFVSYDEISSMGEFASLVFLEENVRYKDYMYVLKSDEYELCLYIEHNTSLSTNEEITEADMISHTGNDLRICSGAQSGKYENAGITYTYIRGGLFSVKWVNGGIKFTFYTTPGLDEYNANNSLINAFLNKELSSNAIQAFDGNINQTEK